MSTDSMKKSYNTTTTNKTTTHTNISTNKSEEVKCALMNQELQQIKNKLNVIHVNVNLEINKDINSRALAISETVAVVQDAVNKMIK